jgi:ribose 5-phosphate isomerase B
MIYIASDHRGFDLKKEIVGYLKSLNLDVEDLGPFEYNGDDDYPLYAIDVAKKVLTDENNWGILICDTGIGMDIAVNKFKGIRGALCTDKFFAYRAKLHNNANVLILSAEYDKSDYKEIVKTFIDTDFSSEERHERRLKEIDEIS